MIDLTEDLSRYIVYYLTRVIVKTFYKKLDKSTPLPHWGIYEGKVQKTPP
jgi:hypothetical protein